MKFNFIIVDVRNIPLKIYILEKRIPGDTIALILSWWWEEFTLQQMPEIEVAREIVKIFCILSAQSIKELR
ncbi:hypothetical protein HZS_2054 [Henneguya salminicola]|nr:hypothetical protein HZS_2054 [Henneguya salminicola]